MIKDIKSKLAAFAGICVLTSALSACAPGTPAPLPEQTNGGFQQGQNMGQPGIDRNNFISTTPGVERNNLLGTTPQPGRGMLGNLGNDQGVDRGIDQSDMQVPAQQMTPDRKKAENIKSQITNMKEVENTNVIVIGNTALVGFKPSGNAGDINIARNMITNKIKEVDKTVTNVIVTEKPDIMDRINRLGNDITNNRPVNQITNEFNQLTRGINPVS